MHQCNTISSRYRVFTNIYKQLHTRDGQYLKRQRSSHCNHNSFFFVIQSNKKRNLIDLHRKKCIQVKTSASQKCKHLCSSPEFLVLRTEAELLTYNKCPYSSAEIFVSDCVAVP